MIDAWFAHVDRAMLAAVPPERLATMNIRGKITALVAARLALLAPNRESLRRAIAILALPRHVIRADKLGWPAADVLCHAAGDKATDFNHYTQLAILGGIYAVRIPAIA